MATCRALAGNDNPIATCLLRLVKRLVGPPAEIPAGFFRMQHGHADTDAGLQFDQLVRDFVAQILGSSTASADAFGSIRANSSPPKRAARPAAPRLTCNRRASTVNTRSPSA